MKGLMKFLTAASAMLLTTAVFAADLADAYKVLSEQFEDLRPQDVKESDIPGLLEVNFDGTLLYATADGRYLIQGEVYDVVRKTNVTEIRREERRKAAMDQVDQSTMLVFEADEDGTKPVRTIMVFTDINCGFCRKLHRQIDEYNELGIRIEYMFFPRNGENSPGWQQANNVWCSEDRNAALTAAKSGEILPDVDCGETPVEAHYRLGQEMGVTGTPALVTTDGVMMPGYTEPTELRRRLDLLADMEGSGSSIQ